MAIISAASTILDREYGRPTKTTSLEVSKYFMPTRIGSVGMKPNTR